MPRSCRWTKRAELIQSAPDRDLATDIAITGEDVGCQESLLGSASRNAPCFALTEIGLCVLQEAETEGQSPPREFCAVRVPTAEMSSVRGERGACAVRRLAGHGGAPA